MIGVLLLGVACMRDPVQRGDEAAHNLGALIGIEIHADAPLQVSLYRNPLVAKGITVYRVQAIQADATRFFLMNSWPM